MADEKSLKLEEVVKKVLIVVVLLLLITSIFGLYLALNDTISHWVGYKYAPVYRVLLNAAILVLSLYVLTLLLKR